MARRERFVVEITEGAIRVAAGGKLLTLTPVRPPLNQEATPDFILALDDIEHWDPPHDEEPIEIEELQRITRAVEDECDRRGLSVEFD